VAAGSKTRITVATIFHQQTCCLMPQHASFHLGTTDTVGNKALKAFP